MNVREHVLRVVQRARHYTLPGTYKAEKELGGGSGDVGFESFWQTLADHLPSAP